MAKRTKRRNNRLSRKRLSRKRLSRKRLSRKRLSKKRMNTKKMRGGMEAAGEGGVDYEAIRGIIKQELIDISGHSAEEADGIVHQMSREQLARRAQREAGGPPSYTASDQAALQREEEKQLRLAMANSMETHASGERRRDEELARQLQAKYDLEVAQAMGAGVEPAPAPVRAAAGGKPRIKVLLTDLDNTLLTNAGIEAEPRYERFGIEKLLKDSFMVGGHLDIDVITTINTMDFLNSVSNDDNIKWFVISSGQNIHKLNALIDVARGKGMNLNYDNTPGTPLEHYAFGLKDKGINKGQAVQAIIENLSHKYEIEIALFIDDEEHHRRNVAGLQLQNLVVRGVTNKHYDILPRVEGFEGFMPTMITPDDIIGYKRILNLPI